MAEDQIIRKVTDECQAGKGLEGEAKGLVAHSAREGTLLADMQLRETGETGEARAAPN